MKRILFFLLLCFVFSANSSSAGPLIVGNGSGLSEFNILYWQRQLGYFLGQCRELEACETSTTKANWTRIETAAAWLTTADIYFEDDQAMGKKEFLFDRSGRTLRLAKIALWKKQPSGELVGMKLDDVSAFLWKMLAAEFEISSNSTFDAFIAEFKNVMNARASEYTLTLADGRRLAAVNSGNSVAGFAILDENEKSESLLFSNLADFAECQSRDGTLVPGQAMWLETLDFAYFVGRLGSEPGSNAVSTVDVVFHGPVTYRCEWKNETWSESGNVRLTVRLSQQKLKYKFEPTATRVRFDTIQRNPFNIKPEGTRFAY